MSVRQLLKKIAHRPLKFLAGIYLRNSRTYRSRGLILKIEPSVFHPGIYLSTNILADFALQQGLRNKRVLELGAGSGFISMLLAREGAQVTASDINPLALEKIRENALSNRLRLDTIQSNLFSSLDPNDFDCILINPPYYPKQAADLTEAAFFCGERFEYFQRLFEELREKWQRKDGQIYIILSEDCRLDEIRRHAQNADYDLVEVMRKRKRGEWNFVFAVARWNQNRE